MGRRADPHGRTPVGELTSAGYSRKLGRAVAMGYARSDTVLTDAAITSARYQVDIAGERFDVTPHLAASGTSSASPPTLAPIAQPGEPG